MISGTDNKYNLGVENKESLTLARDKNNPGKILFTMPKVPTFDGFVAERLHRKQRLVAAFRMFSKYGLDEGAAGHLTCRDPEYPEYFWVNPFGLHFSCIKASDLILVSHEGSVVYGNCPVNAAAFVIHSKIHKARPDAIAACHSHSVYGKAMSALAKPLKPITQDSCAFYNDHTVLPGFKGVVTDSEEGERIAQTLGNNKAIILQNHGLLTVGKTIDEAAFWFLCMEKACQVQLLAEAAGEVEEIPHDVAVDSYNTLGTPFSGWLNFQPYYQMIVKEQPDILDIDEKEGELMLK